MSLGTRKIEIMQDGYEFEQNLLKALEEVS